MGRYGDKASPFGFEDLEVYRAARAFRRRIYKLAKLLPEEEKYALGQQMRRAAVSLTNNIAEGYGRHHWQQNTQFCRQARTGNRRPHHTRPTARQGAGHLRGSVRSHSPSG